MLNRITRKPDICRGKLTICGLRYPVDTMLDLLASDISIDEILADCPDLEREDLLVCLEYAAQLLRTKKSQKVDRLKFLNHQLPSLSPQM